MKRLFAVFILLAVLFCNFYPSDTLCYECSATCDTEPNNSGIITYLVVGFDEGGENTDSIVLMNYNSFTNSFSLMQIPRDTYFAHGESGVKINRLFAYYLNKGYDRESALNALCSDISDSLGISIRGYASFTLDAFQKLVDAIGGVKLTLSDDIAQKLVSLGIGLSLKEGVNHLSGKDALHFVRYREGYALADITRLDAQKIFLRAMISAVKSSMKPSVIFRVIRCAGDGFSTNIKITEILKIMVKNHSRINDIKYSFFTVPGRSVMDSKGVWYYCINKNAMEKTLSSCGFNKRYEFDRGQRFFNKQNPDFASIYNSSEINAKVFENEDLKNMNLY